MATAHGEPVVGAGHVIQHHLAAGTWDRQFSRAGAVPGSLSRAVPEIVPANA